MKVGGTYVDEVLIALLALVVSGVSLFLTYRENRRMSAATERMATDNARMAAANEQMATTNAEMIAENPRMSDANEQMVDLTRRMQDASERGAQIAEAEAHRQAQERTEANKARFVFRDGKRRGDGYEAHLVNRGNHRAENPRAVVTWDGREIGRGEEKDRVEPDDDVQLGFWVTQMAAASPEDRVVTVRLSYAAGNGPHEKEWRIRYSGGSDITSWRSEVISEPDF
jgi:hypothetical protein